MLYRSWVWKGLAGVLAVLLGLFLCPPSWSEGGCLDSFSETGKWSRGKTFKVFVEAETSFQEAFRAIARAIAEEGYLGLNTHEELGIVSAYQEDNGKKSTLTATLTRVAQGTVRVEISFRLAVGLRTPVIGTRDYLCKLARHVLPDEERDLQTEGAGLTLQSDGKSQPLTFEFGTFRRAGIDPVMLLFFDFEGAKAEVRSKSRRPSLRVRSKDDPLQDFTLVRCGSTAQEEIRSVKVGTAGKLLKQAITGKGDLQPDKDWTVPFSSQAIEEGLWELTPADELPPGEYGLWDLTGYGVALFGID